MCIRPPRPGDGCRRSLQIISRKPEPEPTPKPQPPKLPLLGNLPQFNPGGLLSNLDGDTMLILAMMVMLYKDGGWDGCDKKLLMALAYLLT